MLRTFSHGSIEYFIDRERRIVFARWEGDIRGDELLASLPELWRDHPEIGRWSAVHDMMDFTGLLEHHHTRDMMRLRTALVPDFNPQIRTAIVTADRMKSFELKVANASAPDRQFRLFDGHAAALAWVTANEPGNPSAWTASAPSQAPLPWWFGPPAAAARLDTAG